jgi:hypothetical protein
LGQFDPKGLLQFLNAGSAGLELYLQHRLLRPARPEVNRVDGIRAWLHANETHRDRDVVLSDLLLDGVQRLEGELLRPLDPRASRRADAKRELPGVDDREDLASQRAPDKVDDGEGDDEVQGNDDPPQPNDAAGDARVSRANPLK